MTNETKVKTTYRPDMSEEDKINDIKELLPTFSYCDLLDNNLSNNSIRTLKAKKRIALQELTEFRKYFHKYEKLYIEMRQMKSLYESKFNSFQKLEVELKEFSEELGFNSYMSVTYEV